jgi:hypothetical protein
MEKVEIYLRKEASRRGSPHAQAIWDGEPRRTSVKHDSVHDRC